MSYDIEITESLEKKLSKKKKKDKDLYEAVMKKIEQVVEYPEHYKPLRGNMKGFRRVHVGGSFVLIFKIKKDSNKVKFVDLDHHDNIYR